MNNRLTRSLERLLVILIAILILFGLYWMNVQFARNNPGGNDFLVHYVGTRSYLNEGISPYSDEVATRIQVAAYGHPAEGEEHELRVAYPLYSVLLFSPFAIIGDYLVARAIWMTVLEIGLIGMTFLCFELFEWKPGIWIQAGILLFSMIWYHAVRGVVNGNAVILIAFALTAIFLILWILIWSVYQKRWELIFWFLATMVGLVLIGVALIPDWLIQNLVEVLRYPGYNPAGTLAEALAEWLPGIANQLKWGIWIGISGLLILEWSKNRTTGFDGFLWGSMLTLVLSQWIGIQTDPGNFILLFPALLLILSLIAKKFPAKEVLIVSISLGSLFLGLWLLFILSLDRTYQPVQGSVMFLPVPALCLIGLYWVRHWTTGPQKLLWGRDE